MKYFIIIYYIYILHFFIKIIFIFLIIDANILFYNICILYLYNKYDFCIVINYKLTHAGFEVHTYPYLLLSF